MAILTPRSKAEQDAYMAGQRSALRLARERGLAYAEKLIEVSQAAILDVREPSQIPGQTDIYDALREAS